MSLRINLNSAALTAHRQLAQTDSALGKSIERLSSGYKINSAGDDPAALVISEKLRAQMGGLSQAIKNAGDAVNMVKTAEGALSEVSRLLGTMRTLAVHAASTATTDAASLAADQAQITSAIDSINKISSETQFGGKKLLDGSAGITTTITGSSVTSASISSGVTASGTANIDVTVAATKATLTDATVDLSTDLTGKDITINGVTVTGGANSNATLAAINARTNDTGVIATASGTDLVLTQREYGSDKRITITGADAAMWTTATDAAIGVDVQAEVTTLSAGTVGITDLASNGLWNQGKGTVLQDSLGNTIQLTGTAASNTANGGHNNLAAQFGVAVGSITFQVGAFAGQTRSMTIDSVASALLGDTAGDTTDVSSTTANVSAINVTTKAQDAMTVLDKAISDVSNLRASLGSTQKNVLESSINSLSVAKENIASSESSIRDTDMAAEMVEFSRNNILTQAGMAMLAQANQGPQALLKLLQ